jgi:thiol-disulfide isomerase/thioredoxin
LIETVPRPERPDWRFYFLMHDRPWKQEPDGTAERDVIEEDLPEGTYQLDVALYDGDSHARLGEAKRALVVPSGDGPLDLPTIELGLTVHGKMVGKPAPEIAATDLDTGRPVMLADFRGKVVILDFWGYWCGPCTGNMPQLAELQRKFAGRPLEILALHDQSVQTRAEYDKKIAPARRLFWGGRDLPFRVLLDQPDPKKPDDPIGTGKTIERYEIEGFPTLFVIDGDGTMVGRVGHWEHDRLEALVRDLVGKAQAR